MFAESMLETSWAQRTRRSWTTLTSFALQAVVLAGLLTISLMTTVGLPESRVLQPPISWGAPPPPLRNIAREHTTHLVQSNLSDNILIAPPSIPYHIRMIDEIEPPPQVSYNTTDGVDGGTDIGSRQGVWGAINPLSHVAAPAAPAVASKPEFRTSSMLQGSLVRRVDPVYPPLARSARIQGQVVLAAIISKAGAIEHLQVLSGHPMLVNAALEAVSQWRYRPYVLNGEVIEVETQITVNFKLN
ncbi:MAG: TonB family protein [Acidobacteriota bacterium]